MNQQLVTMLEMQNEMNTRVHSAWRDQGFAWYRAIWTECAELLDHYGWKWWKKQEPDLAQVKLELIDIWHFGMSILLLGEESHAELSARCRLAFESPSSKLEFREAVEGFAANTLTTRSFDPAAFVPVMKSVGMTFDELFTGYIGKNVLNFFRQDNGYKEGTYQKLWSGREDNEHLVDILEGIDSGSGTFRADVYAGLKETYESLGADS